VNEKRFFAASAALTLLFGVVLFFLYNKAVSYEKEVNLQKQMDSLLVVLDNQLSGASNIALSSSFMLSENPYIINCLLKNELKLCFEYLIEVKNAMSNHQIFQNMGIHLHTRDHKSFIRLWAYENHTQDDLSSFRHSLEKVKNAKTPLRGIEIGRYGLLDRAVAPIFYGNTYIGSIETVIFPTRHTEFFKRMNIDFYILIKNSYLPIITHINYPSKLTLKNYTIVNQDVNGISFLDSLEFSGTGYLKNGDKYVLYTPIIDVNNDEVGYYALVWNVNLSQICDLTCETLKMMP
jgi:hypothetical protein